MKTPSDKLFKLIQSLDSHEKRNFKLFTQRYADNASYLALFDAMAALDVYDEKKVEAVLEKKKYEAKNYKHIKSRLQEALLKFVEYHYSTYSIEIQLQRYLQKAEVFYSKNLVEWVTETLNQAEKLAIENECFQYLLVILEWKFRIMQETLNVGEQHKYLYEGHSKELGYLENYKNILEYRKISVQLHVDRYKETVFTKANSAFSEPLLKNESGAQSHTAKLLHYRLLSRMYFSLSDWQKCYYFTKQSIDLFEQKPSLQQDKINEYVTDLGHIIVPLSKLKYSDELLLFKNKAEKFIRSLPNKLQSRSLDSKYLRIMINYIAYNIQWFNFGEAVKCSDEVEAAIEKYGDDQFTLVFYCNLLLTNIYLCDYRKAARTISKIVPLETKRFRGAIIKAKMVNLIVHYELGNTDFLPNLCRSTSSYLSKHRELKKTEKLLLHFFSKTILQTTSRQDKINAFTALKNELELVEDPNEKKLLKEFDFISWTESKIKNKTFAEIVMEQSRELSLQS